MLTSHWHSLHLAPDCFLIHPKSQWGPADFPQLVAMWVHADSSGDRRRPGLFFHLQEINVARCHLSRVQNVFKLPGRCAAQVIQQNSDTNTLSLNMFLCSFQFILQEVLSRNWLCVSQQITQEAWICNVLGFLSWLCFLHKRVEMPLKSKLDKLPKYQAKATQRWEATAASCFLGQRVQRCRPLGTGQIHAYKRSGFVFWGDSG